MKFYPFKSRRIFLLILLASLSAIAACSTSTQTTVSPSPTPAAVERPPQTTPSPLLKAASYPRRPFPTLSDQVTPGSSFDQFRNQLQQAIRSRDSQFIQAIADPAIKITFGPPLAFKTLGFDNPNSLAWKRLERILSVGCARYEAPAGVKVEAYQCPHVSQSAMGDPFTDIYIIGAGVNVRSQPRSDGQVLDTLTNEIVKSDPNGFEQLTQAQRDLAQTLEGWMPVITPTGQRGYVSSRYAFFAAGYRARFEQKQGQWKMTIFINGD